MFVCLFVVLGVEGYGNLADKITKLQVLSALSPTHCHSAIMRTAAPKPSADAYPTSYRWIEDFFENPDRKQTKKEGGGGVGAENGWCTGILCGIVHPQ